MWPAMKASGPAQTTAGPRSVRARPTQHGAAGPVVGAPDRRSSVFSTGLPRGGKVLRQEFQVGLALAGAVLGLAAAAPGCWFAWRIRRVSAAFPQLAHRAQALPPWFVRRARRRTGPSTRSPRRLLPSSAVVQERGRFFAASPAPPAGARPIGRNAATPMEAPASRRRPPPGISPARPLCRRPVPPQPRQAERLQFFISSRPWPRAANRRCAALRWRSPRSSSSRWIKASRGHPAAAAWMAPFAVFSRFFTVPCDDPVGVAWPGTRGSRPGSSCSIGRSPPAS